MKNTNEINSVNRPEEEIIEYKKILYLLRRQWKWIVLFCILGTLGAYGYLKTTTRMYVVDTSILVPEKSKGLDMKELFQGAIDAPKNNIYNQIEILKSYYTINKVLMNLNWRTSWYAKDLFVWKDIYKQEPFDVQETQNFVNLKNIAIYITPTSGDNYTISVDGKAIQDNSIINVKFENTGAYNRPFINKYFNFTLLKKVNNFESPNGKYYFVFNDLDQSTQIYQKKLEVSLKDKKSDIILCSITGEEPNRESSFLNELVKVYTESKMDFQNEAQRRSLDFINQQLTGITDSLNTAGTKFTEFRSRNNIIDLGAEGTLVMNNLKEIETEKAKSQLQLDYFRNLLEYLDNNHYKEIVSPSVVGIQDASLNALVLKLGELYNRRQIISFSAKENNPTLLLIDKELNQTRNQLSENLRNLIDNATRNINSQKDRQATINVQLNKLPQKEQQMVNIQRQFNLTNEIYTFLLQKRAETNISLASSIPDVQVIDIARPETASITGINPKMILGMGFFLGFSIPFGFILLVNIFDDRIRTQNELEKMTNIPILGEIIHSPTYSDLAVFDNPKSNVAESYRALRTNLQFMLTSSTGKVISIHSTNPGEGKSFSSINVATILALNSKKVILIGADMRKPKLHKVFDISNEKGLSTYLVGIDSINDIIIPTLVENLSLLPSGPIPPNPSEILSKPEMSHLVNTLRSKFDYVIIDNAPTSLVTDAHIISHLSDLNVFILRYGVSHKNQLEVINQYVDQKTIENVSLLINDIKINAFGHSYYKYYQYESYQNTYYSDEENGKKKKSSKKKIKSLNKEGRA